MIDPAGLVGAVNRDRIGRPGQGSVQRGQVFAVAQKRKVSVLVSEKDRLLTVPTTSHPEGEFQTSPVSCGQPVGKNEAEAHSARTMPLPSIFVL